MTKLFHNRNGSSREISIHFQFPTLLDAQISSDISKTFKPLDYWSDALRVETNKTFSFLLHSPFSAICGWLHSEFSCAHVGQRKVYHHLPLTLKTYFFRGDSSQLSVCVRLSVEAVVSRALTSDTCSRVRNSKSDVFTFYFPD